MNVADQVPRKRSGLVDSVESSADAGSPLTKKARLFSQDVKTEQQDDDDDEQTEADRNLEVCIRKQRCF